MEYNFRVSTSRKIPGNLREEAFFLIVNSEVAVWDALQGALQNADSSVGAGRFIPLHFLASGPMRLQELAQCTHAKESALSRLVERMVKDGLISKERENGDRRAVVLQITDKGRRVELAGRKVFSECLDKLFGTWDENELGTLCTLLARLEFSEIRADS